MLTDKLQNVHKTRTAVPLPVCHTKIRMKLCTYFKKKKCYCSLQEHDIQKRVFTKFFLDKPNKLRSLNTLLFIK